MRHILNVLALVVVISFSFVLSGCSGVLSDQHKEAENEVSRANDEIAKHNQLFDQARESYGSAREKIEAGEDPDKQKDKITEARETLQKARGSLQSASTGMQNMRELDVDPVIKKYGGLLSKAMGAQLSSEAREIEFYGIMEKDPALKENRDRALKILSQAGDDHKQAEKYYADASELAKSNPKIIDLPPDADGENQGSAPNAPEGQQNGDDSGG
ncbi:MAG: hypothetical protein H0V83_12890 [Rubrobacter sp.]|nr:hypothetical protein [Rubrobacter sp.]